MDFSLRTLINETTVKEDITGDKYNLFSFFEPRLPLRVIEDKYERFFNGYCELLLNNEPEEYDPETSVCFNIGEKPTEYVPVIIKMKFKFMKDVEEPYEDIFIKELVYCAQQVIMNNYELSSDAYGTFSDNELKCSVLECASDVIKNDEKIRALCLHFSFCKINLSSYKEILIPKFHEMVRKRLSLQKLRKENPIQPNNDWGDIIEDDIFNTPYPLYGSITNGISSLLVILP